MEPQGWIKLHRKLSEHPIYTSGDAYLLHLWVYLLLSVNHKEKRILWNGKEKTVKKGSGIFGLNQLTKDLTKLKRENTPVFKKMRILYYRRLKTLENLGCVQLKPTNKYTVISIVNWDKYQSQCNSSVTPVQLQCNSSVNKQECKECKLNNEKNSVNFKLENLDSEIKIPKDKNQSNLIVQNYNQIFNKKHRVGDSLIEKISYYLDRGYSVEDFNRAFLNAFSDEFWGRVELHTIVAHLDRNGAVVDRLDTLLNLSSSPQNDHGGLGEAVASLPSL